MSNTDYITNESQRITRQRFLMDFDSRMEDSEFKSMAPHLIKELCEKYGFNQWPTPSTNNQREGEKVLRPLNERIAYLMEAEGDALNSIDAVPVGNPERRTHWEFIKELGHRKNELQDLKRNIEAQLTHTPSLPETEQGISPLDILQKHLDALYDGFNISMLGPHEERIRRFIVGMEKDLQAAEKALPVEEVPAKRIVPKDPYFVGQCNSCGYKCSSEEWGGGSAIADTGDYTDPYCPLCLSKDVDEADDDLYIDQTELLMSAIKKLQEKVNCLDFEVYTRDNQIGNKDCKIGELQIELSSLCTQLAEAQKDRDAFKNRATELQELIIKQAHKSQDNV